MSSVGGQGGEDRRKVDNKKEKRKKIHADWKDKRKKRKDQLGQRGKKETINEILEGRRISNKEQGNTFIRK